MVDTFLNPRPNPGANPPEIAVHPLSSGYIRSLLRR